MPLLPDDSTLVIDEATFTKYAAFDCTGLSAGRHTFAFPDLNGMFALINVSQTWQTGQQTFYASIFRLVDASNPTANLQFDLSGATAGKSLILAFPYTDDRTITFPDATDTLAALGTAQTWTALQTFKDTTFIVGDDGDTTKAAKFSLGGATTAKTLTLISSHTDNRSITFPDATTTLAGLAVAQTITAQWTYSAAPLINGVNMWVRGDPTGGTWQLRLQNSAAGAGSFFSTYIGNETIPTAVDRYIKTPSVSGTFATTGISTSSPAATYIRNVGVTAQHANIASTNLTNTTPAGFYQINYVLSCTALDAGAGTVTVTFAWTDRVGATTQASAALPLTATGRTSGVFALYLASGNITFSTSGTYATTDLYALDVRAVYMTTGG